MTLLSHILPVSALIGAVGIGCTTLADNAAPDDRKPIACAVNILPDNGGLRVFATARADTPMTGDYDLVIKQSGRAGSATIRQSGDVDLRAGRTETLGEARMSGRAADIDATLTLRLGGKTYRCGEADQPVDL
ncbi:curli-like amyloid fiber formation chaperone CsgH [Anianabacter salinae]|uniref:curli-like amyloid fiber formation chaperone CsgH n=1 Tax=Anianabacter salinae TaxID=2851023 RepID=UPI00225DDDEB|nr:curli-like amyloid fiber formation chaperone CsgH [Anianabacter salinae]MBV0913424.1 hypothetical protein [Anianabacter salinae]